MAVTFGNKVEYETNGQQLIVFVTALRRDGYVQLAASALSGVRCLFAFLSRFVCVRSLDCAFVSDRTMGLRQCDWVGQPPAGAALTDAGLP